MRRSLPRSLRGRQESRAKNSACHAAASTSGNGGERCVESCEKLGKTPHVIQVPGEGWAFEEIGRREGIRALEENRFPTNTVLCSNDRLAIGFLAACYEKGLRVGRDEGSVIRVAGQDDHPFSRFTCPPLTTVAQDYEAISRHAVATLFDAIAGDEKPRASTLFQGRLVMRDSA